MLIVILYDEHMPLWWSVCICV